MNIFRPNATTFWIGYHLTACRVQLSNGWKKEIIQPKDNEKSFFSVLMLKVFFFCSFVSYLYSLSLWLYELYISIQFDCWSERIPEEKRWKTNAAAYVTLTTKFIKLSTLISCCGWVFSFWLPPLIRLSIFRRIFFYLCLSYITFSILSCQRQAMPRESTAQHEKKVLRYRIGKKMWAKHRRESVNKSYSKVWRELLHTAPVVNVFVWILSVVWGWVKQERHKNPTNVSHKCVISYSIMTSTHESNVCNAYIC